MPNSDEEIRQKAEQLVATGRWGQPHAYVAVRAKFKCEYCNLDLLESVEGYRLWQLDHIVPKRLMEDERANPDHPDNLAIACCQCNYAFKRGFDPRTQAGATPDRPKLIETAKAYIALRKRQCAEYGLTDDRRIAGRKPLDPDDLIHRPMDWNG